MYVARKVRVDAIAVLVMSTVIEIALEMSPRLVPKVELAIPALLGTSISLLLSFKLSQSYDRWWEARKIWGAIVNDSRSLVRQLLAFAGEPMDVSKRIGRRQMAW